MFDRFWNPQCWLSKTSETTCFFSYAAKPKKYKNKYMFCYESGDPKTLRQKLAFRSSLTIVGGGVSGI